MPIYSRAKYSNSSGDVTYGRYGVGATYLLSKRTSVYGVLAATNGDMKEFVNEKQTVNLGLRLDNNYGWENASCQPQTDFVDARCFEPLKGVPDWTAVNPRFSAIYDVSGDGKTAIKFAANRYIGPVGAGAVARVNPIKVASDTRRWTACSPGQTSACDLNGDLLPQLNELGPSSGYDFGVNQRYAAGNKWPWAREYTIELQRQLPGNILATAGYTRREKKGNLGVRNVSVPTSGYLPVTVTEVNSSRSVTVYNQDPATRGKFDYIYNNEPSLDGTFNGGDITVEKRLSHGWMLTGGVSLGKNIGDIYDRTATGNELNNPNLQFARGIAGNDVPFSLRLSGLYELPYQISASATLQHQSGFPEITSVSVGNNTIVLTQGSQTITVTPRGTTRLPDLNQLDASFRRPFRSVGKVVQPRIDFYNLLNSATITSRVNTLGSSYLVPNSIQRGRLMKLGFSVDF